MLLVTKYRTSTPFTNNQNTSEKHSGKNYKLRSLEVEEFKYCLASTPGTALKGCKIKKRDQNPNRMRCAITYSVNTNKSW